VKANNKETFMKNAAGIARVFWLSLLICLCTVAAAYAAPVSVITSPVAGGMLPLGSCVVTGTASSPDGVAFVEVSTDGGLTWNTAKGGESWSYAWLPTADGSYKILSRATDSLGKTETPGAGVPVAVGNLVGARFNSLAYPSVLWTQQMGGTGADVAKSVAVDSLGNVYTAGSTHSGLDGNTYAGAADLLVVKYDSTGVRQWTRQIGTTGDDCALGVTVDGSGNVYAAGYTNGVLDGTSNAGGHDILVVKYNSAGVLQWTRQMGTTGDEVADGLSVDSSGNVYAAGWTKGVLYGTSNAGGQDIFVVKYNSAGVKQWTRQMGTSSDDVAYGVSVDGSGNVYLGGDTYGGLDGKTNAAPGTPDTFLVKYNSSGVKQWTVQTGTIYYEHARWVTVDSTGSVYLAGITGGGLDGYTNADPTGNTYDIFVTNFNPAGVKQWTRQIGTSGTDYAQGVSVDRLGNVYVVGETDGGLDGNTSAGGYDIFVTKYSSSAVVKQWTKQMGTSGTDYAYGVSVDGSGYVYLAGCTTGGLDGNTNAGLEDMFVMKLDTFAPTSAITAPAANAKVNGTNYSVTGTATDGDGTGVQKVEVSTNGGTTWVAATGTTAWSYNWTLPADGSYTIKSRATDVATNVETPGAGVSVTVDKTAPTSTITAPANSSTLTGKACTIAGTASDNLTGVIKVQVSTDGGTTWVAATGTTSWSYTWNLPVNGSYTIKFRATDAAGNVENPGAGRTVVVNNPLPSATITAPADNTNIISTSCIIAGTTVPNVIGMAFVDVSLDGGTNWLRATDTSSNGSWTTWKYLWASPQVGSYPIIARATDKIGNVSTPSAGVTVTVGCRLYITINPSTQVNPTEGGTVIASPDGADGFYAPGTLVLLGETPSPGYVFLGWSGGATGTKGSVTVTMLGDKTVKANFKKADLSMTQSCTQDGSKVTLSATMLVNGQPAYGKSVAFYEKTGSNAPVLRGSATINAEGVATKAFTSTVGAHSAYVKYTPPTAVPIDQPNGAIGITGVPGIQSVDYAYTTYKVTAVSPADKEVVTTSTPTLNWNAVDTATSYHVQVSLSSTFGLTTLIPVPDTGDTFVTAPSLTLGRTYYWRVQATIVNGKSIYSDYRRVIYKYGTSLTLEDLGKTGSIIKMRATLTRTDGGTPVPGKTLTFYENTNGGLFASKGTAVTGGATSLTPGVAAKSWTTAAGTHHAYVKFIGDATFAPSETDPATVSY